MINTKYLSTKEITLGARKSAYNLFKTFAITPKMEEEIITT